MRYFDKRIIAPYILENRYQNICEVGANFGGHVDELLRRIPSIRITVIDPCFDCDLVSKYQNNTRVKVLKGLSLDVLKNLSETLDCILIDGDHNWYTVFNELKIIHERELLKKGGSILFHDVCWPYGRRDLYYAPESIPKEHVHPYAKKGMIRGQSELSNDSGLNSNLFNALNEGGPRNGVMTAIEDFLILHKEGYRFFYSRQQFGLGVLLKNKSIKKALRFYKWQSTVMIYDFLNFTRNRIGEIGNKLKRKAQSLRKG